MINFANPTWRNDRIGRFKSKALAVLFLLSIAMGLALISSGSAKALDIRECTEWTVLGDSLTLDAQNAGLEQMMSERGASGIEVNAKAGMSVRDIAEIAPSVRSGGQSCLIIDAGARDLGEGAPGDLIRNALNNFPEVNSIFWVMPNVTSDFPTPHTKFNSSLKAIDKSGDYKNLTLIDVSSLTPTINGNRFEGEENQKRVSLILDAIEGKDDPTPPSSGNNPGGNNSGGNNPGGNGNGGSGGGYNGGALDVDGDGASKGDAMKNSLDGANRVSPAGFAEAARTTYDLKDAKKYLTINRWHEFQIPEREFDLLSPSSYSNVGARVGGVAMTWGATVLSWAYSVLAFAMSATVSSAGLNLGDYFFAKNFGVGGWLLDSGNADGGTSLAFITSIFIIAAIVSLGSALAPSRGGDINARIRDFGGSIVKVVLVLGFIMFVGTQSQKNHSDGGVTVPGGNLGYSAHQPSQIEQSLGNDIINDLKPNLDRESTQTVGKSINTPSTWAPLSIGWLVSAVYWVASTFSDAVMTIVRVFLITPMAGLSQMTVNNDGTQGDNATGRVCNRFIDSMHTTFMSTPAVSGSGQFGELMRIIDLVNSRTLHYAYSELWGAETVSADSGWCWAMENVNRSHVGDWMMISRGAGLYTEGVGAGNLVLASANANTIATGRNSPIDIKANLDTFPELGGSRDGYLVKADGTWQDFTSEEGSATERIGAIQRAELFMGKTQAGKDEANLNASSSQARYYFSVCDWAPHNSFKGSPNVDWNLRVMAMGATGNFGENENSEESVYDVPEELTNNGKALETSDSLKGIAQEKLNALAGSRNNNALGNAPTIENTQHFINITDCQNPALFPIGTGDTLYGWGSDVEAVKRWNFAPIAPSSIPGAIAQKVKDSISDSFKQILPIGGGEEGEKSVPDEENPSTRFVFAENVSDGRNYAREFWSRTNGYDLGASSQGTGVMIFIYSLLMAIVLLLVAIPVFLISFVFSFVLMFVGFFAALVMMMFVIRGAKV